MDACIFVVKQALGLLVSVSSMRYRTSTSDLSTLWSTSGLTNEGILILKRASHLDAFSGYHFPT